MKIFLNAVKFNQIWIIITILIRLIWYETAFSQVPNQSEIKMKIKLNSTRFRNRYLEQAVRLMWTVNSKKKIYFINLYNRLYITYYILLQQNTIVLSVFNSIMRQTEFHLVHNIKKKNRILLDSKGIGIFFSLPHNMPTFLSENPAIKLNGIES